MMPVGVPVGTGLMALFGKQKRAINPVPTGICPKEPLIPVPTGHMKKDS